MKKDFNNTSNEQEQNASSKHDSLLGTLLFESFCGSALEEVFADAMDMPEWARELDADLTLDLYEEYREDRTNGGFKLGVKNGALNGMFNRQGRNFNSFETFTNFNHKDSNLAANNAGTEAAARGRGSFVTAPAPALH